MGTKKLRAEGKEVTPQRIIATANAYVLYVLGAVIFPDVSVARVSANFIQLVQPFGEIRAYSWATAILSHSLKELRKASRSQRNQIGGNMAFMQAWIYMHFPIFAKRAFENKDWDGENYGDKYNYKSKPKKQKMDFLNLRRLLDNLKIKDVVFVPYKEDLAKGKVNKVGFREQSEYFGPLFHPRGYVMYNPTRVARQCSYVKIIPKAQKMFNINETKTKSHDNDIIIVHKPFPSCDYWNDRAFHRYPLYGPSPADDVAIPGYIPWYLKVSQKTSRTLDNQVKLEIREGKNVKANEKLIDEFNGLEDVEAGANFPNVQI
ncbi:protein MAINTENANCE OF MERISTEMS-like [Papaver somniferum]|uniref:protein MAINTENANCE OF MERISTEMS-like n=1 Tax=Papaver somniferum TaxID=3469 RepID=UPI000E6F5D17|nr:protein MAINTENANCE OF MERISTEMS-like [Papaver somniferum]